jgi:mono/diheme cytochrome c family protein
VLALAIIACGGRDESVAVAPGANIDGEALYLQYCAECHGEQGEGQPNWKQPNSAGVYPAPPHDSAGHTWHHSDDLLIQIIVEGGSLPASTMPAFGDQLGRAEIQAILDHIRTFWGAEERAFQQQVSQQGR